MATYNNNTDNTIDERMTTTRKQKWEGKQLYGRFKRLINNISHQKTWTWLRKRNRKKETESLLIAAQDNAIKQMDQRIKKLMTMHKALHPRDDNDRLYVSRKEGGRWFASIEDSVDASIQRLEDYLGKNGGLITAIRNNTDNTMENRMTITRKKKWEKNNSVGVLND